MQQTAETETSVDEGLLDKAVRKLLIASAGSHKEQNAAKF